MTLLNVFPKPISIKIARILYIQVAFCFDVYSHQSKNKTAKNYFQKTDRKASESKWH